MKRMPRKYGRHSGTSPEVAGQAMEYGQKQERGGGVQQNTGEMMLGGGGAKKLAIQHVRKPGEGMPIAGVKTKGPDQSMPRQTRLDTGVFRDVLLVIKTNEIMPKRWQV